MLIGKTEDMKNVEGMDISVEESCINEYSNQANVKLDYVNEINFITEPRECVKVYDEVICHNDTVKVEMDISKDIKMDTREQKLNCACLEIAKTKDMRNIFSCNNASGKADRDNKDSSKQVKVELLDCDDNYRNEATEGIFIKCVNDNTGETLEPGNAVVKIEKGIQNRNVNTRECIKISDEKEFMKSISGIKNQNIDPSVYKGDIKDELNRKWLEPGKIENVKVEADPSDIVDFDGAFDAQDGIAIGGKLKPTDVMSETNFESSNSVRWYNCKFCRFRSQFENKFKEHLENKHREGPQRYCCHLCEFETVNMRYLKSHFKRKHDDSAEWYKCQLCDLETKQKDYLARHYKTQHYQDHEWFHCQYCAFKTKYKGSLKKHWDSKHDIVNIEGKLQQCQFCDYRCKFKSSLRHHLQNKHSQNVECHEYQCQNCEFKTNIKANLIQHYGTFHNQDSANTELS